MAVVLSLLTDLNNFNCPFTAAKSCSIKRIFSFWSVNSSLASFNIARTSFSRSSTSLIADAVFSLAFNSVLSNALTASPPLAIFSISCARVPSISSAFSKAATVC